MNICNYCGQDIETDKPLCDICEAWGITTKEIYPTFSQMLTEQHKHERKLGGGILFTDGKKVLLLKRNDGDYIDHWGIPGGKAKKQESPKEVAAREAKEECGFDEGKKFGQFVSHDTENENHCFHTFLHSIVKPFEAKLSKEHSEAKWADLNEVNSLKLHPKFKKAWPTFLEMIKERFPEKTSFVDWFTTRNS